jgi:hypothetical protein
VRRLQPVALNHDHYSTGPWGAAARSDSNQLTQLLAPVFPDRYAAELFCAVCHLVADPVDASAGAALDLAQEIADFHRAWEETQDGLEYLTHDGRYPSAQVLAGWFVEARRVGLRVAA